MKSLNEKYKIRNFKLKFIGTWLEIINFEKEDYIYIPAGFYLSRIRISENLYVESKMDGNHPNRIISVKENNGSTKIEVKGPAHSMGNLDYKDEKIIKFEDKEKQIIKISELTDNKITMGKRYIRFKDVKKYKLFINYTNNPVLGNEFKFDK